jgi:DNA polymerase-3 subunit beta
MPRATLPKTGLTFRAEPKPFTSAVTWVAKHLPNRPVIPMLAGLLIEVADGRVTVSAFDYEVAVRAAVDVVGETDGRAVVSGRLLAALVATFPDKPIDVSCTGAAMEVVCGSIRVTLPTMPVDDYPELPAVPEPIGTVDATTFADMVERVAVAADRDTNQAVVWQYAIRLALGEREIELMATNRYRAALGRIPWQGTVGEQIALVPMPTLVDAAKVLANGQTVTIGVDPAGLVGFASTDRSVVMRQIDVDYPVQMKTLFPERQTTPSTAPVADLASALKRSNLVRTELGPTLLTFRTDGLVVETQGQEDVKTAEALDCTHGSEDVMVAVNGRFLADAISALPGDVAEFSITTPLKPVLLTAQEDKGATYSHLVMPIRVQ